MRSKRITVPLTHGLKLVAETSGDPEYPREMYIGIEDRAGCWVQDIVIVMNNYHYKSDGQLDYMDDAFKVLVYEDENNDDATRELLIRLRREYDGEELEWTKN